MDIFPKIKKFKKSNNYRFKFINKDIVSIIKNFYKSNSHRFNFLHVDIISIIKNYYLSIRHLFSFKTYIYRYRFKIYQNSVKILRSLFKDHYSKIYFLFKYIEPFLGESIRSYKIISKD